MKRGATRVRALGAGVSSAVLVALACSELGPEGVPASIAFDELPYPAVVIGDSLRDENGLAVPLSAAVFDARNAQIPDAPVLFISLDTTVTISAEGFVTGESFGPARIVAQIGGLQTSFQTLQVTRQPDTLVVEGEAEIVVEYEFVPVMQTLAVRLEHLDPLAPEDTEVPGWTVAFELAGIAPDDSTRGYLVRETGAIVKTALDTTDATGRAGVRYRLNPATFPVIQDTLEVLATARYRGQPVPGSPVRFTLIIRPAPLP